MSFPSLNITQKFIGYLILLSVIPLLAVGIMSYQISSNLLKDETRRFTTQLIINQRDYLDLQLTQIESLISNIAGVEEIREIVTDASLSSDTYTNLNTQAQIGYILNSYSNLEGLVSIDIFTVDGVNYHVGDTLNVERTREDIRDKIFTEALTSSRPIVWVGIEDNININSTHEKVVTAAKILYTVNRETLQQEPRATILVNYSVEYLYDHLSSVDLGNDAYLMVIDNKQRIIYHPDKSLIGEYVNSEVAQLITHENVSSITKTIQNVDMAVNVVHSDIGNWIIAGLIPVDALTAKTNIIQHAMQVILLICFVAVGVIGWFYNRNVVTPIRQITQQFKQMQNGVISHEYVTVRGKDDIAELSHWFNTFLDIIASKQKTEDALRDSLATTQTLYQSSRTLIELKDLPTLLKMVVDNLKTALSANQIKLHLVNPENNQTLSVVSSETTVHQILEVRNNELQNSLIQWVLNTGQSALISQDTSIPSKLKAHGISLEAGIASQIVIPLQYQGKILGTVTAINHSEEISLTEDDMKLMVTVVNQAAIAIENTRLIQSLQDSEEKFFKAFHANPDPMTISLLDNGQYIDINQSFLHLTGYRRGEVINQDQEQLKIWSSEDYNHFIQRMQNQHVIHDYETTLYNKLGEVACIILISAEVIELNGRLCILTVSKDITERKQNEKHQLQLGIERERVHILSGFITEASHEFRTPLAIINTNAYLLRKTISGEAPQEKLIRIEEQVKVITMLVDSLNLMTMLDSGGHKFNFSQARIDHLLQELHSDNQLAFAKAEIDCTLTLDDAPLLLLGDSVYLKQALGYIIQNAIQFTPPKGSLTIHATTQNFNLIILFKDSGIGISEEELPHIFERFYQSDKAGTIRGFGLGLPIAKSIIEHHNGTIEVESIIDEGSTFKILLPQSDRT